MAESWTHYDPRTKKFDDSRVNEIWLSSAAGVYDSRDEAYENAFALTKEYDAEDGIETEYGVQFNRLCKDDAEVKIIELLAKDKNND